MRGARSTRPKKWCKINYVLPNIDCYITIIFKNRFEDAKQIIESVRYYSMMFQKEIPMWKYLRRDINYSYIWRYIFINIFGTNASAACVSIKPTNPLHGDNSKNFLVFSET